MEKLRIDKWLWAARFFKTRSLSNDEIEKGRVRINGVVAKPSREIQPGDILELHIGRVMRTVNVLAISNRRGPASEAVLLYQKTEASIRQRQLEAEQRQLAPEPALTLTQGRPTKRDRRETEKMRYSLNLM